MNPDTKKAVINEAYLKAYVSVCDELADLTQELAAINGRIAAIRIRQTKLKTLVKIYERQAESTCE